MPRTLGLALLLLLTACMPGVRADPNPATLERVVVEGGFYAIRVSGGTDVIHKTRLILRAAGKSVIRVNDPLCFPVTGGVSCDLDTQRGYLLPFGGNLRCARLEYQRERPMPVVTWPEGLRCD